MAHLEEASFWKAVRDVEWSPNLERWFAETLALQQSRRLQSMSSELFLLSLYTTLGDSVSKKWLISKGCTEEKVLAYISKALAPAEESGHSLVASSKASKKSRFKLRAKVDCKAMELSPLMKRVLFWARRTLGKRFSFLCTDYVLCGILVEQSTVFAHCLAQTSGGLVSAECALSELLATGREVTAAIDVWHRRDEEEISWDQWRFSAKKPSTPSSVTLSLPPTFETAAIGSAAVDECPEDEEKVATASGSHSAVAKATFELFDFESGSDSLPMPSSPTPECNWLIGGRLLFGALPDRKSEVSALLRAGVTHFVCLMEWSPPRVYGAFVQAHLDSDTDSASDSVTLIHFAIPDFGTGDDYGRIVALVSSLKRVLTEEPRSVLYVHCLGGHGRSGTVAIHLLTALCPEHLHTSEAVQRYVQQCHDCGRHYCQQFEFKCRIPESRKQLAQCKQLRKYFVSEC